MTNPNDVPLLTAEDEAALELARNLLPAGHAVVPTLTREKLREALGEGGWTTPDEAGFEDRCWQEAEIFAALTKLGVMKP